MRRIEHTLSLPRNAMSVCVNFCLRSTKGREDGNKKSGSAVHRSSLPASPPRDTHILPHIISTVVSPSRSFPRLVSRLLHSGTHNRNDGKAPASVLLVTPTTESRQTLVTFSRRRHRLSFVRHLSVFDRRSSHPPHKLHATGVRNTHTY